jgi:hypothetical protein
MHGGLVKAVIIFIIASNYDLCSHDIAEKNAYLAFNNNHSLTQLA